MGLKIYHAMGGLISFQNKTLDKLMLMAYYTNINKAHQFKRLAGWVQKTQCFGSVR